MKNVITASVPACAGCGEKFEIGEVVWESPLPAHWAADEQERLHLACYAASVAATQ